MKLRGKWAIVAALGMLPLCCPPGCHSRPRYRHFTFSWDGRKVAYATRSHRTLFPPPPYTWMLVGLDSESEHVFYGDVDAPQDCRKFLFDLKWSILFPMIEDADIRDLSFSPDSSHLAIISDDNITILNTQSGKHWRLAGKREAISSFRWLSDEAVEYVALAYPGLFESVPALTWTVYRQDIHAPREKRRAVFWEQHKRSEYPGDFYWSPDSKYLIVATHQDWGHPKVVDLDTGKISPLLTEGIDYLDSGDWKPGSSALLYKYTLRDRGYQVKLLDLPTRGVRDFTKKFHEAFGQDAWDGPEWMPDGEYVLVHSRKIGACLVRLEPWKVIPFEQTHDKKLPEPEWDRRWFSPFRPGWLLTTEGSKVFAVGYETGHVVLIGSYRDWVMAPGHKHIAEVDSDKGIKIHDLVLPPLEKLRTPETKPTETQ